MDASNTRTEVTKVPEPTLGQDVLQLLRYYLRDRRVLIALAAAVVAGGAFLNWGWLVAIGAAPILLALAPCAAMCALGLCTMGRGDAACSKSAKPGEAGERDGSLSETPAVKRERISGSE